MINLASIPTPIELWRPKKPKWIVRVMITQDEGALHNFVTVFLSDETRHTIYFRNIKYPEPRVEDLIGMSIKTAKKYLQQDEERAKHE